MDWCRKQRPETDRRCGRVGSGRTCASDSSVGWVSLSLNPSYAGYAGDIRQPNLRRPRSPDGAVRNPGISERAIPGFRSAPSGLLAVLQSVSAQTSHFEVL